MNYLGGAELQQQSDDECASAAAASLPKKRAKQESKRVKLEVGSTPAAAAAAT